MEDLNNRSRFVDSFSELTAMTFFGTCRALQRYNNDEVKVVNNGFFYFLFLYNFQATVTSSCISSCI